MMLLTLATLAALAAAGDAVTVCKRTYANPTCSGAVLDEQCVTVSGYCKSAFSDCVGDNQGTWEQATCADGCFPGDATVLLEGGETKRMDAVTVGDRVLVGAGDGGVFSDVFMFSHSIRNATAEYVQVTAASGAVLRLTESHYLYVNGALAPAGNISVGDVVTLADGTASAVVAVHTVEARGIYNPHTMHGDIVVDGVTTSTYTTAVHPTVAHAVLAPLRMLYAAGIDVVSASVERALPLLKRLLPPLPTGGLL